jgi:outer membrane protein assembly factor BamB
LNTSTGNIVWKYKTTDWDYITPTLTPYNDTLFYGSYDNTIYGFDAYNGTIIWRVPGMKVTTTMTLSYNFFLFFGGNNSMNAFQIF